MAERRLARRHRLGGLVLRLPRRHRDRQAAGQGRRRPLAQGQGRRSPTRSWPTRPTRRSSPPTAGGRWRRRAPPPQRPLWASTGVKNPEYPDTMYISELIAPGTVNTMPEKTMKAYADHGTPGTPVQKSYDDAAAVMQVRRRRRGRPRRRLPGAGGRGRAEVRRLLGRAHRLGAQASSRTRSSLRGPRPPADSPTRRPVHRRAGRRLLPYLEDGP